MRHMHDASGSKAGWILDAGCGSGSATIAALRCGMNAIAYDNSDDMVKGVLQR